MVCDVNGTETYTQFATCFIPMLTWTLNIIASSCILWEIPNRRFARGFTYISLSEPKIPFLLSHMGISRIFMTSGIFFNCVFITTLNVTKIIIARFDIVKIGSGRFHMVISVRDNKRFWRHFFLLWIVIYRSEMYKKIYKKFLI